MQQYDQMTGNGVEYIGRLYKTNTRYKTIVDDMDMLYPVYKQVMSGKGTVQSYTIATRSLTRSTLSAGEAIADYKVLRDQKMRIEQGRSARKAVGVVPRDL